MRSAHHRTARATFARHTRLAALSIALIVNVAPSRAIVAQSSSTTSSTNNDPSVREALLHLADKRGLWGSLGVGQASAGLHCAACSDAATRAYAFHGAIGLRLAPRFLIGAETFAFLDVMRSQTDRIARGSYLIGRLYRAKTSHLYFQGGVGLASFRVHDDDVSFNTRSPSLLLATGYDWHVQGVTVTPSITAVGSSGGKLTSDRTKNPIADNARLGMLRASVALSWFR